MLRLCVCLLEDWWTSLDWSGVVDWSGLVD